MLEHLLHMNVQLGTLTPPQRQFTSHRQAPALTLLANKTHRGTTGSVHGAGMWTGQAGGSSSVQQAV